LASPSDGFQSVNQNKLFPFMDGLQ
jgi:hypothetical protein